jgi:hypothetical protein
MNIIEMANESGLVYYGMGKDRARFIHHLEAFAALVAAAARADEREACAKLAETTVCDVHLPTGTKIYGSRVATAIRARGTT